MSATRPEYVFARDYLDNNRYEAANHHRISRLELTTRLVSISSITFGSSYLDISSTQISH